MTHAMEYLLGEKRSEKNTKKIKFFVSIFHGTVPGRHWYLTAGAALHVYGLLR
jgi:hypothetical protein